jgi:hypothetical protein
MELATKLFHSLQYSLGGWMGRPLSPTDGRYSIEICLWNVTVFWNITWIKLCVLRLKNSTLVI